MSEHGMAWHGHGHGHAGVGSDVVATPDQVVQVRQQESTYKLVYFRHGRSKVLYTTDREWGLENGVPRPTL